MKPGTLADAVDGKNQRFTAPVRRGFERILRYLEEDVSHDLLSHEHPLLRRGSLRCGQELNDIRAALIYMAQNAEDPAPK